MSVTEPSPLPRGCDNEYTNTQIAVEESLEYENQLASQLASLQQSATQFEKLTSQILDYIDDQIA